MSQSAVTGSGSAGDPFRLVTIVEAGDRGMRIEQTDSYEVGEESYRTDVRISNTGASDERAILYRAGDCYLQDSDAGFGRVDDGAPACVISQDPMPESSSGSRSRPGADTSRVATRRLGAGRLGASFPDQCLCDQAIDNGAGLSWEVVIPAGGSVEVSHLTFFSPEGRQPRRRCATPSPARPTSPSIRSCSPRAQSSPPGWSSFVPFPAALFNSTLEDHYAEVMAAVARLRGLAVSHRGGVVARGRRAVRAAVASPRGLQRPAAGATAPKTPAGPRFSMDEAFWSHRWASRLHPGQRPALRALDPTLGFDAELTGDVPRAGGGHGPAAPHHRDPAASSARGAGRRCHGARTARHAAHRGRCVVISRVAEFQPGYVYGMIIGITFSRQLAKARAGKIDAVAAAGALALAVVAWLLLPRSVPAAPPRASLSGPRSWNRPSRPWSWPALRRLRSP